MKRALRRHQQQLAKRRKLVILYFEAHGHSWRAFERSLFDGQFQYRERPWLSYGRLQMSEPGYWENEMMIQPSRIRQNRKLRLVENGCDPDAIDWPDYRKPVIYYW